MRTVSVLVFLLVAARAEAQSCELRGTIPVSHVRVTPAGGTPLELDLEGLPLAVTPGPPGAHVQVRTTGALALEGTVPTSEISLAFAGPTSLAGGVLRAGRTTRVVSFVGEGQNVRLDLELEDGVTVGVVAAPCASLRLAPRSPERPAGRSRGQLVPAGAELALAATPGGATEVTVHLTASGDVHLQKVGTRPGFVHVRARLAYAELDGWVAEAAVRPMTRGLAVAHGASGPPARAGRLGCEEAHEGEYVGPATLQSGAEIADGEGHVWARTTATLRVGLVHRRGTPRARVMSIPGVFDHEGCGGYLDRAFVPFTAVVLPPGIPR